MNEYRDIAKEKSSDEIIVGLYDKEAEEYAQKVRDQNAWLEQGTEKGFKQGLEQGDKQGFERGTLQGSREEKIRIAKEMLKNNIDIKVISKCTSLSIQEIEELK